MGAEASQDGRGRARLMTTGCLGQGVLGHSRMTVTMDISGHQVPEAGRQAAACFEEYLATR